jgi:hypothetical protein
MNGAHYDAQAPLLQKLVETVNELCCEHVKKTGFAPGLHDFEEKLAVIVRDGVLTALLNEQIFHGGGESREKRIGELLMKLGKVTPIDGR